MTVALLVASWVFWLGAGLLIGLWANRPWARGLPHHPVLHSSVTSNPTLRLGFDEQRQLRLVGPPRAAPYDYEREGSA